MTEVGWFFFTMSFFTALGFACFYVYQRRHK